MILRTLCLLAVFTICLASAQVRGQEGRPGTHRPGESDAAAVTGPEKKYVELSHSTDRIIKVLALQYLDLIKLQEWGGTSGKKNPMAKYVSHDPDLTKVKLSVAMGTGKDRVFKEYDVEVEKLNKTSKDRLKRIDILQKRLDKLAAADAAKANGGAGRGPEAPAAAPATAPTGPEATPAAAPPTAAAPVVDPSESEPDPLGFAELPPVAPSAAGAK